MSGLFTLLGRQLTESRWLLGLCSTALFALSWLSVFRTANVEARIRDDPQRAFRIQGFLRTAGGPSMDMSSLAIETIHLYFLFLGIPILLTIVWAISRGAGAVAGDLERGTIDMILSRPVSRSTYLLAQVLCTLIGLLIFMAALVVGNLIGTHYNHLSTPASLLGLVRPALNLALVGWSIYGYTLFLSSIDQVRWRPNLIASVATLAQFVALAVANQPDWDEWKWLNQASIFGAFSPVEAAVKGESLAYNSGVLGLIGGVATLFAFLAFNRRDLPAGSG